MTEFPAFRSIEIARAKINLSLHVLGRRPDHYHELAGLMATIELADRLDLFLSPAPEEDAGWEITADSRHVPAGEANLCYRAVSLFFAAAGLDPAAAAFGCHIEKRIPQAAGLGGGSADAAAVLRFLWGCWQQGLAEAFRLDRGRLTPDDLERIALACGADVPFCLLGGVRYCQGVGERMSPAIKSPSHPVLLALPPLQVSTAEAFRQLDQARQGQGSRPAPVRQPPSAVTTDFSEVHNDFLELHDEPGSLIRMIIRDMKGSGALAASMSGSGPACFGLFAGEKDLNQACGKLAANYPDVRWVKTALSPLPEKLAAQN